MTLSSFNNIYWIFSSISEYSIIQYQYTNRSSINLATSYEFFHTNDMKYPNTTLDKLTAMSSAKNTCNNKQKNEENRENLKNWLDFSALLVLMEWRIFIEMTGLLFQYRIHTPTICYPLRCNEHYWSITTFIINFFRHYYNALQTSTMSLDISLFHYNALFKQHSKIFNKFYAHNINEKCFIWSITNSHGWLWLAVND